MVCGIHREQCELVKITNQCLQHIALITLYETARLIILCKAEKEEEGEE